MKNKIIIILSTILTLIIISGSLYYCYKEGYIFNEKEETKEFEYMPITYEICDTNSCVYLLGSIHIGDSRITKFNKKLTDLYNKSKYLAVELDTTTVKMDVTEFVANPNETLNDILSQETQDKLKNFTSNRGLLTYEQLKYFKIGYIANYLSLLPAQELGLVSPGVDEYFINKAHQESKEIIELETYEEQLNLLLGYSNELYINEINDIIDNYQTEKDELKELYEDYLKGDKEAIVELLDEENEITTEEEREYQNDMIYNRNKKMTTKVEEFLKEDKEVFMIVGSAHVLGRDGIIDLLQNKEYKINMVK